MMHMAKAVATQVARKTVATTSTIGGRAAPACQAASGLRRADMAHKGSRWLSTSGTTAGSPAGGEERLSGSGGEDLLRGLSEEEVKHARTAMFVFVFFCCCFDYCCNVLLVLPLIYDTKASRSHDLPSRRKSWHNQQQQCVNTRTWYVAVPNNTEQQLNRPLLLCALCPPHSL